MNTISTLSLNTSEQTYDEWIRAAILLLIALPCLYLTANLMGRVLTKRIDEHTGAMLRKAILAIGFSIIFLNLMLQLGFDLRALLGAAGIASVAIGFASQTSLSNIISGVFLYWEKPFQIGDLVRISDTLGIVQSIDLMSTKIRKLDNIFVRIPNETILKTTVETISKYPIRRMDINIGVDYKENITHVMETLKDVAERNPYCLDEPQALITFKDFGDSSLNFMLGLWFQKTEFLELKNSIMKEIKERFDEEGIDIPFPHQTLYAGSQSAPFPIHIVNDPKEKHS